MSRSIARRTLLVVLATCHFLLSLGAAQPALAQGSDRTPPSIAFDPLGEGRRGDTQVFSVRVTDEGGGVERVTFHFRAAGGNAYESRAMTPLVGTDIYTVSIDDLDPQASAIEFYIDALDRVGNRSIEGFAFDPLVRVLVDSDAPLAGASERDVAVPATGGMSTGRKILYGVLGVVAIGALAAAAGGGGGGGGGGDGASEVPVTVVAEPLQ